MKKLDFFVGAWLLAIGLLLLISVNTPMGVFVAHLPGGRLFAWPFVSIILALASWGLSFMNDSLLIRRQNFLFLIAFNVIALLCSGIAILFFIHFAAVTFGFANLSQALARIASTMVQVHFWALILYVLTIQAIISFMQQMANMIGPRVLANIILGRYRHPKTEERVFMFLDLKGSTTIAEKLGHEKFCRLIQDCFFDLTQSALAHELEIYQYGGDEAILTWDKKRGSDNANCISVFYDFNEALMRKREYYLSHYEFVPRFKAGVNVGAVTVAEVGTIKRDIAYLSDVLNTAARIEGLCNKLGKRLLISEEVKKMLVNISQYKVEFADEIKLRGKNKLVKIYSVERL